MLNRLLQWKKYSLLTGLILAGGTLLAQEGRLKGFVTDAASGEALIGANVYLQSTSLGTATDFNGYYIITAIPVGKYTFIASYLGYETVEREIELAGEETQSIDFALPLRALDLEEVVVSGERITRKYQVEPSKVSVSPMQVRSIPAVVEPDLFRTIQSLPGVLTQSEFSTGLVIRGGNTDQNLILLDGITVYNPSHLGGVFSNFIVDAVKEADLIKGGYNAEYGGRLSAVLNILSREGNRNEFKASSNISLLAAQTTLEGPSYNGAWIFSARRTYFDQILKYTPYYVPYYFYDLQGHVFSDLTTKDRVSLSFYAGLDDLLFDDLGLNAEWGNRTVSLAYRRLFNDRLIGNFLVASSQFSTMYNLGGDTGFTSDNLIDDQTMAANWSFFQSREMSWKFGAQVKSLGFGYENAYADTTTYTVDEAPIEAAGYIKLKLVPGLRWVIEPGFRLNYYNNHPKRWYPDLRLGVKYILAEDRFLNFAVGNYHQFIETVQDDFNPSILDNWFAVDSSVEPASAVQYVLGYEEYLKNRWKMQFEVYYKSLYNLLTFVDTRSSTDGQLSSDRLSDTYLPSDGYAYGLEAFVQKTQGQLTGWVSYTWSVARKIMDGQEYYTNWDRTHAFNILAGWQFKSNWQFNGNWTWQSGQAYTPILGYYTENLPGDPEPAFRTIPGTRNSGRYPAYHRLDLSLVRQFKFKRFDMDLNLQVINAYNRKNIYQYVYTQGSTSNGIDDDGDWDEDKHDLNNNGYADIGEPNVDEEDEGIVRRSKISIFPLLPSIGVSIRL